MCWLDHKLYKIIFLKVKMNSSDSFHSLISAIALNKSFSQHPMPLLN